MVSDHQLLKKWFANVAAGYVPIFCNLVVIFDVGGICQSRLVTSSHLGVVSVDKTLMVQTVFSAESLITWY